MTVPVQAWHPVALSRELRPGGWLQVRLLGRTWTVRRSSTGLATDPPAAGVREHLGLVWLAPADPVDQPLDAPEAIDRRFVSGWLPPVRSAGPAGPLADALLDPAHVPFVHGGPVEPLVTEVLEEPGGFSATQDYEAPVPRSARGGERRRLVVEYRAPFQLRLRQELPMAGVVSTVLFFVQPEDADSTRVYARVLLSAGSGRPLPAPSAVVQEMAFVHRMLEEDIALLARTGMTGLPLDVRQELHVPADRLGVALRRALCDFATTVRQSPGSSAPQAGHRVGGSSSAMRPHAGQTRCSQQAGSPPSSSGTRDGSLTTPPQARPDASLR
jgi:phenylpropionate dioxygenase-like ring-hydroxylating dioxygenase large terminal subunit